MATIVLVNPRSNVGDTRVTTANGLVLGPNGKKRGCEEKDMQYRLHLSRRARVKLLYELETGKSCIPPTASEQKWSRS